MQVCLDAAKRDREAITTLRDPRDMQRLCDVARKVGNELDRVGACAVLAVLDLAKLGVLDAALQDLGLVRQRADDAPALGAITVVVNVAKAGRLVRGVNPVPLRRVGALVGVPIAICPGSDAAQATLSLGLQELLDDRARPRRQELLCCVSDLLVY
jgi:hypothetical protein